MLPYCDFRCCRHECAILVVLTYTSKRVRAMHILQGGFGRFVPGFVDHDRGCGVLGTET